jgi:transposase
MANKRIEMINLRHLLRLKAKGLSNRNIAKTLQISRPTVDGYVHIFKSSGKRFPELYELTDVELAALFPASPKKLQERYAVLSTQFSYYEKELKRPGATYLNLWEEYRQGYPAGYSYTQFRYHLSKFIHRTEGSMRQCHKYGDKMFVDYCGKKMHLSDRGTGELIEVEVYVAILGGSQYIYVEASESQQLPAFLESTAHALEFFGGASDAIVPDNLKSAVTNPGHYEPQVNRNFQAFGLHYNTTILPARAYKPKDKSLVEGAVKLVYRQVFFPLRNMTFFTLADLNQAIAGQLEKLNSRQFQGLDYSRRELFVQYEKDLLTALPATRYELRIYRFASVRPDFHVRFKDDKHFYSVPYQYKGKKVQLQATHSSVEIYYHFERIAWHPRAKKAGGATTKREHLPPNFQFVHDWSLDFFLQQGSKMGPQTLDYFRRIFENKTHPEQAYKSCLGIMNLRKFFSVQRIELACQRAHFFGNYTYKAVKTILEKRLDQADWKAGQITDAQPVMTESDPNIRGSQYFK